MQGIPAELCLPVLPAQIHQEKLLCITQKVLLQLNPWQAEIASSYKMRSDKTMLGYQTK
jgi:hypothetical protein